MSFLSNLHHMVHHQYYYIDYFIVWKEDIYQYQCFTPTKSIFHISIWTNNRDKNSYFYKWIHCKQLKIKQLQWKIEFCENKIGKTVVSPTWNTTFHHNHIFINNLQTEWKIETCLENKAFRHGYLKNIQPEKEQRTERTKHLLELAKHLHYDHQVAL